MRSRKKFDAKKFLHDIYIKGDYAIIPIKVNSIEDFYDRYDSDKNTLSQELATYIEKIAYNIPIKYKFILKITCPNLNDEDKKEIERLFRAHYGLAIYDKDLDLKINGVDVTWLFGAGVSIISAMFLWGSNLAPYLKEVLSIIGWVAVWDAVEDLIVGRRKILTDKKNNKQIYDSEFYYTGD